MEDGYILELFKLFRESQCVQPPKKPQSAYERFAGNYERACQEKNLNHNSDLAKKQWENLEKELKDEYFRLSKQEGEFYEKLLRQYHSISSLIKKKKADGSVLFFQEKGVNKGLTNLQQQWDELKIEEKQIFGQKAQQNFEETIKVQIEEYITEYQKYLIQQNERPQDLFFVQKIEEEQDELDQIDIIIGIKRTNGKKEYLVRFKGKTGKDAKWFPKKKLRKVKEIVKKFEEKYFKQSFQDNESSSDFDSTPAEQIFQDNQKKNGLQKQQQEQQQQQQLQQQQKQQQQQEKEEENKIEEMEEEKQQKEKQQVKSKVQSQKVKQIKKSLKNGYQQKSVTPQKVKKQLNPQIEEKHRYQSRRSNIINNKTISTPKMNTDIIQEQSNKKQDKIKIQKKQKNQSQDDQQSKLKSKKGSLNNSFISTKEFKKQKDNIKSTKIDQPKRQRKQINLDSKFELSINKRVKKQLNEVSPLQSKLKTPQLSTAKEQKSIRQIESNQSQEQNNSKINESVIFIRQRRSRDRDRDLLNTSAPLLLSTKNYNQKNEKQEIKELKLFAKQQQIIQQQTINNSKFDQFIKNKNSKQVSKLKTKTKIQEQNKELNRLQIERPKTRSKSHQLIKQIQNNENKKQIKTINRSRSVEVSKTQTIRVEQNNKRSRSSKKVIEKSKSPKKAFPIEKSQLKIVQLKEKSHASKIQLKNLKQQINIQNKNLKSTYKSLQAEAQTRKTRKNTQINKPIKINKKISKNKIQIIEKKQKKVQVNQKKQKSVAKIVTIQTRQLRSKKSNNIEKRKH